MRASDRDRLKVKLVRDWIFTPAGILCVLIASGILVVITIAAKNEFTKAKRNATLSTAQSICSAISSSRFDPSNAEAAPGATAEGELTRKVMELVVSSGRLDGTAKSNRLTDAWGNEFVFRLASRPEGNKTFSAISRGPDAQ